VLTYLPWIAAHTQRDTAQLWVLRSAKKPHDDPWDWLVKVAAGQDSTAAALYDEEKFAPEDFARNPLAD
jgi:hypothetical protein